MAVCDKLIANREKFAVRVSSHESCVGIVLVVGLNSWVNSVRFHSIITSDALVLMNLIVSCSTKMTAPKLAQIRFQARRSWVILAFYCIAFGFPRAMEVIISSIFDFI